MDRCFGQKQGEDEWTDVLVRNGEDEWTDALVSNRGRTNGQMLWSVAGEG